MASLRDRRVQLVILGVLALVLVVLVTLKLTGGSGTPQTAITLPSGGTPSGTPPGTPTLTPSPSATPTIPPILVFSGRDPFQSLFGSPSPTGTTSPTTSPTGTTSPTTSPTGSPSPTSTGTGGANPSTTVIGGHTVQIDDVFRATDGTKKAQVEVDGTVYTVAPGQTFDGNFKLISFSGDPCGNFVFGDQAFTLCTAGGK